MNKAELIALLASVPDDEPLWLLRGSDKIAPQLVQSWHAAASRCNCSESRLVEAMDTANAMRSYPHRKFPR